jgi:elongation factor Ts
MAVAASQVKELRELTGAGMMECKKALEEVDGDMEKAIDVLRTKNIAKAVKKGDRTASEGLVVTQVAADGKRGVIVEVNCETDFVARGDLFKDFAERLAVAAMTAGVSDVAALLASKVSGADNTWEQERQNLVIKVGENVNVRRLTFINAVGHVSAYLHGSRIGVLIDVVGGHKDLHKDLAMHVAASNPIVVSSEAVSPELIAKEREIYLAQAAESGKPADIIEKMVNGRITKFLDEVSLMGQPFVKDPSLKVGALLKDASAKVESFARFEVGEGIAKKEENFAAEVMAQVRGS